MCPALLFAKELKQGLGIVGLPATEQSEGLDFAAFIPDTDDVKIFWTKPVPRVRKKRLIEKLDWTSRKRTRARSFSRKLEV